MIEQKINDLLTSKFKEEEFEDCFLVETKLNSNTNALRVYLDSDKGLAIAKCQKISRYLESYLDEELWLGEKYTLEVSSPGLDQPLQLLRQYKKNIGRPLIVEMVEGKKRKGKLVKVTEESISLEEEVTIKEGKKKKRKELVTTEIPLTAISKAKLKILFK